MYFWGVFVGLFLLFWEAEEKQVLNDKSQTDSCSAGGSSAGLSELSHSLRPRHPRVTSSQLLWWLPVLLWPLCSPLPRMGARLGMLSRLGRGLRNPPAQQPPSSLCRRDLALQGFAISSVGSCCQCSKYPGQVCAEQMAEPWKSKHDISAQICWLSRLFTELGIAPWSKSWRVLPQKTSGAGRDQPCVALWHRGAVGKDRTIGVWAQTPVLGW